MEFIYFHTKLRERCANYGVVSHLNTLAVLTSEVQRLKCSSTPEDDHHSFFKHSCNSP
jgi:hypothetical protein